MESGSPLRFDIRKKASRHRGIEGKKKKALGIREDLERRVLPAGLTRRGRPIRRRRTTPPGFAVSGARKQISEPRGLAAASGPSRYAKPWIPAFFAESGGQARCCGTLVPSGCTGAPVSVGGHPDRIGTSGVATVRPLWHEKAE